MNVWQAKIYLLNSTITTIHRTIAMMCNKWLLSRAPRMFILFARHILDRHKRPIQPSLSPVTQRTQKSNPGAGKYAATTASVWYYCFVNFVIRSRHTNIIQSHALYSTTRHEQFIHKLYSSMLLWYLTVLKHSWSHSVQFESALS